MRNWFLTVVAVALAGCDPIITSFPVQVTLEVEAEGQLQRIERVHNCVLRYNPTIGNVWDFTSRIAHPLPSGGSLLFKVSGSYCDAVRDPGAVIQLAGMPTDALAWIDDLDDPTTIEFYELSPGSISDRFSTSPKIITSTLRFSARRISGGISRAGGPPDAAEIAWFGFPPSNTGRSQRIFTRVQVWVLRRDQWEMIPGAPKALAGIAERRSVPDLAPAAVKFARNGEREPVESDDGNLPNFFRFPLRPGPGRNWIADRARAGVGVFYPFDPSSRDSSDVTFLGVRLVSGRGAIFDPHTQELFVLRSGAIVYQ